VQEAELQAQPLHLVRLLQLASPALPVGGYSYSQGLEAVVEAGTVRDAASAQRWIGDLLDHVLPRGELAVLARLLRAVPGDFASFARWHTWWRASRETRELRAESEQMGAAMVAWMRETGTLAAAVADWPAACAPITWPGAYALACHADGLAHDAALTAYTFAWLENQTLAAIKLVPLGQAAGARLLRTLGARVPHAVATARSIDDDSVASFAPGLALACARHETQYSRLFRS
jgi:urease accessory protein